MRKLWDNLSNSLKRKSKKNCKIGKWNKKPGDCHIDW